MRVAQDLGVEPDGMTIADILNAQDPYQGAIDYLNEMGII